MLNHTLLFFTNIFQSLIVTQSAALMQYTQGTYLHVACKRIKQILKC